ncbi:MAG: hypothetical protein EOP56_09700 [Sphingobacteriales bacterium]|nr:MAG: hypothetical protein EOP56_09700 [Sphingobacteriales bacterium]
MKYIKYIAFFVALLCADLLSTDSFAQIVPDTALTDPIPLAAEIKADTSINMDSVLEIAPPHLPFEPIPKRAGLYAAIIPGAGQLYNRQYWKIPIVIAGLGTAVYFFQDNLQFYQSYRKAYLQREQDPNNRTLYPRYEKEQLKQLQNNYRQNMDMTVLFGVLGYAAQILDAVAAAHLKNFDVSRDISMNMSPVASPNGIGFGLVMNFK